MLVVTMAVVVTACGHVATKEEAPPGTTATTAGSVTTVIPVTTAAAPTPTAGPTCLSIVVAGLKLNRDYARDVRSFAGADEASYKARARALADDARRLGCPVPASIQSFLR